VIQCTQLWKHIASWFTNHIFTSKIMFLAANDVNSFECSFEAHVMCWFTCLERTVGFSTKLTRITELTSCYTWKNNMRVTAQTTAASATEFAKSFGASTPLWWTNAALAPQGPGWKIVHVHANARMARRTRGLDHSENYISQSDSWLWIKFLINVNQAWHKCEKHNTHTQ
jgi:hypothetical protein